MHSQQIWLFSIRTLFVQSSAGRRSSHKERVEATIAQESRTKTAGRLPLEADTLDNINECTEIDNRAAAQEPVCAFTLAKTGDNPSARWKCEWSGKEVESIDSFNPTTKRIPMFSPAR